MQIFFLSNSSETLGPCPHSCSFVRPESCVELGHRDLIGRRVARVINISKPFGGTMFLREKNKLLKIDLYLCYFYIWAYSERFQKKNYSIPMVV